MKVFTSKRWLAIVGVLLLSLAIPLFQFRNIFFFNGFFWHEDMFFFSLLPKAHFFYLLKQGLLSFFFPLNSLGFSSVAVPPYSFFYPTNFLFLFTNIFTAYKLNYLIHYPIAGLGFYFALQVMGFRARHAICSCLILLMSGVVWSSHYRVDIATTAWMGWAIWAYIKGEKNQSYIFTMASGVFIGFQFLGDRPNSLIGAPILCFFCSLMTHSLQGKKVNFIKQVKMMGALGLGVLLTIAPSLYQLHLVADLTVRKFVMSDFSKFKYSTPPIRILDLVWPNLLNTGKDITQLWFLSRIMGISASFVAILGFLSLNNRRIQIGYGIALLIFALISMGSYFPLSKWVWNNVFPFTDLRYPEKFFRYIVFLLIPLIALGSSVLEDKIKQKWATIPASAVVIILMIVATLEIQCHLPKPYINHVSHFMGPSAIRNHLLKNTGMNHRVLVCPKGLLGKSREVLSRQLVAYTLWGTSFLKSGELIESQMVRVMQCPWVLRPGLTKWLGVSHVLTPSGSDQLLKGINLVLEDKERKMALYQIEGAGPKIGLFSSHFKFGKMFATRKNIAPGKIVVLTAQFESINKGQLVLDPYYRINENGIPEKMDARASPVTSGERTCQDSIVESIPIKTSKNFDFLSLSLNAKCSGVVNIPWAFTPGWKATVNNKPSPIYQVGEATLGVLVSAGKNEITLELEPPFYGVMVFFSFFYISTVLALLLLKLIFLKKGTFFH